MGAFSIFVYYLRVTWFGNVRFYFLMGMFDLMFSKKYSLQVTQNTNCLYHSSPFISLVFSSSLLGDPSLLPKLSLPHSSRIADYMQKKQQPNKLQSKNEKDYKKNVIRKMQRLQVLQLIITHLRGRTADWIET